MNFRVGQKVVCIDADPSLDGYVHTQLCLNSIYTVRGIDTEPDALGNIGLWFVEIADAPTRGGKFTTSFRASRFRPAVERKTDISIFTKMLDGASRSPAQTSAQPTPP